MRRGELLGLEYMCMALEGVEMGMDLRPAHYKPETPDAKAR